MGGRDGGTLPPGINTEDHLEIFIDLMCRKINLEFEKSVEHKSLSSLRFIPPPNAMGSHQDMDPNTGYMMTIPIWIVGAHSVSKSDILIVGHLP